MSLMSVEETVWYELDDLADDEKRSERNRFRFRLAQLFVLIAWRDDIYQIFDDQRMRDKEMMDVNRRFEETVLFMKPMWQKDGRIYDAVVKLCMEMGRTPPIR